MNHVTSFSTSEGDVTWVGFKSMFIYAVRSYLEAGGVPGQVRADPQNELVLDEAPAPNTGRTPVLTGNIDVTCILVGLG